MTKWAKVVILVLILLWRRARGMKRFLVAMVLLVACLLPTPNITNVVNVAVPALGTKISRIPFDNSISLYSFIASNILKYRSKGGWFKTPADFGKVYGITPEKLKELEPFMTVHEKKQTKTDSLFLKRKDKKKDIIVELNSADTTLLMLVTGIGRGYAKGIIRFRQLTGGFVNVDQLTEIYGMRQENFEKILPFCKVNAALIKKIKVNKASVERLKSHPYLNFYQSKAIYELRRKKGKLNNINELKILSEFSSESLTKIETYLSFE